MLYLRRNLDERICVFDNRAEVWIAVREIGMDTVVLSLGPGRPSDPTVELCMNETVPFLQGAGSVTLDHVADYNDGTRYVNIGVHAPRDMLIKREEIIAGMDREQRASLVP